MPWQYTTDDFTQPAGAGSPFMDRNPNPPAPRRPTDPVYRYNRPQPWHQRMGDATDAQRDWYRSLGDTQRGWMDTLLDKNLNNITDDQRKWYSGLGDTQQGWINSLRRQQGTGDSGSGTDGKKDFFDDWQFTPYEPKSWEDMQKRASNLGDIFENPQLRAIEQNLRRAIQAAENAQARARADYGAQRSILGGQFGAQRSILTGAHEAELGRLSAAYDAQHGRTGADYKAQFDRLDRAEGRIAERDLGMAVARGAGRSGVVDHKDIERARDFAIEHGGLSAQKAAALSGILRQKTAGIEGLGAQHMGAMAGLSTEEAGAMAGLSMKELSALDSIANNLALAHTEAGDQRSGLARDRALRELEYLRELEDREYKRGVDHDQMQLMMGLNAFDRTRLTPQQQWDVYFMLTDLLGEAPDWLPDSKGHLPDMTPWDSDGKRRIDLNNITDDQRSWYGDLDSRQQGWIDELLNRQR